MRLDNLNFIPFSIGERVKIKSWGWGTVVDPERADLPNTASDIWVFVDERGFASRYAVHNIIKLTGDQK